MINRRRALWVTIGAAMTLGAEGCRRAMQREKQFKASRTAYALGSEVTIVALHARAAQAMEAVNAAFDELELIESILSIYRPQSQVSRLVRDGQLGHPHEHLLAVLQHAQRLSQRTHGAFDVTVQPLWQLFRDAQQRGSLPDKQALAAARRLVDYRQLRITPQQVRLGTPGAAITLNGIAQGYAADRVAAVISAHGVEHALANTGEMCPLGGSVDGDAWTVGIQHPRDPASYVALVKLDGRALATSGDYATTFSNDYLHHHIIDPRRGTSPGELASVSVIAPSAVAADALSTAVLVLGSRQGLSLIRNTPKADALLVLKDGRTRWTAGFPLIQGGDV